MIPGAAGGIERRGGRIETDPNRAALMRRGAAVEGARKHDRIAGGLQALAQPTHKFAMRTPVAALPIEPDASAVNRHAAFRVWQVLAHRVPVDTAPAQRIQSPFGRARDVGFQDRAGDAAEQLNVPEPPATAVVKVEVV